MIKLEDVKLGDIVYHLETINNMLRKQRISMVDADGTEWYRYDRDDRTYEIHKYTHCGTVKYTTVGDIGDDDPTPDEYYFFKDTDGTYHNFNHYDGYFWNEGFTSLEAALKEMTEQDRKWNRKTTTT